MVQEIIFTSRKINLNKGLLASEDLQTFYKNRLSYQDSLIGYLNIDFINKKISNITKIFEKFQLQ